MANDSRPFRQEVRRLVLKSERRLITAEWPPILRVKIDDSSGNPANAATIGMPAMFDPKRETKFAEVVSVKRADPHQVALLNRTEVFQAMASQAPFRGFYRANGFRQFREQARLKQTWSAVPDQHSAPPHPGQPCSPSPIRSAPYSTSLRL
jgi:hypothetical protein